MLVRILGPDYRPIYRSISLLSLLSKVVVHEQTTKFLSDNNINLASVVNHSTEIFLSFLNDYILKVFDNKPYIGIILIDLPKTFNTVSHKILLDRLLPIGFSEWYESFFSEW